MDTCSVHVLQWDFGPWAVQQMAATSWWSRTLQITEALAVTWRVTRTRHVLGPRPHTLERKQSRLPQKCSEREVATFSFSSPPPRTFVRAAAFHKGCHFPAGRVGGCRLRFVTQWTWSIDAQGMWWSASSDPDGGGGRARTHARGPKSPVVAHSSTPTSLPTAADRNIRSCHANAAVTTSTRTRIDVYISYLFVLQTMLQGLRW